MWRELVGLFGGIASLAACEATETLAVVVPEAAGGGAAGAAASGGVSGAAGSGGPGGAGGAAGRPGVRLLDLVSDPVAIDTDPTVTGDRLELIFMSDRQGSEDLWVSRRSDPSEPWPSPERIAELSSASQDENPSVSADGLVLWFYSDRDRALGTLWRTARSSRDEPWGEPVPFPELSIGDESSNVAISLDASGLVAVLSSKPTGDRSYDLYVANRPARDQPFDAPIWLEGVNSDYDEFDPFIGPDSLFLAFHSNRLGAHDLFWSRRSSSAEPFGEPTPLETLNSPYADDAITLTPDLNYVVFSSDRGGSRDLYEAELEL